MAKKGSKAKGCKSRKKNKRFGARQVHWIRKNFVMGSLTHGAGALAEKYGTTRHTILRMVHGDTYQHIHTPGWKPVGSRWEERDREIAEAEAIRRARLGIPDPAPPMPPEEVVDEKDIDSAVAVANELMSILGLESE